MGKLVRREQAVPAEDGASDVWGARLRIAGTARRSGSVAASGLDPVLGRQQ